MNEIICDLFNMQDPGYREFQSKLIPGIDKEKIIGIRTPLLRKYAKQIYGTEKAAEFLTALPHNFYEENNLHAFLIELDNNFENTIALLDRFLPYVDNWATCDGMSPKILGKNTDRLLPEIFRWISSKHTYTVRFGILCLMRYYLEDNFDKRFLDTVCKIPTEEYYIHTMVAWYFATALAKQYDKTVKYIESPILETKTHNKAIQKAIESNRLTKNQKAYLSTKRLCQ